MFIFIFKSYAHQPILNEENPISINSAYIIEKPEVSKAIYSTLNGGLGMKSMEKNGIGLDQNLEETLKV